MKERKFPYCNGQNEKMREMNSYDAKMRTPSHEKDKNKGKL